MSSFLRIVSSASLRRSLICAVLSSSLWLAACSPVREVRRDAPATTSAVPAPEQGRYEALIGQGAEAIAELRAAPPPATPEVRDGKNPASDEQRLGGQGYLRIGNGFYPADTPALREIALRQGQRVGADLMLLYAATSAAPTAVANASDAALTVAYYVHFKPPFGASFRDLSAAERETFAVTGGIRIGAVIGGTPAAAANLLAGDVVLTLDGMAIANKAAFQDSLRANAGKRVTLGIHRDGVAMTRIVRIGLLPPASHKN